MQKDPLDRVRYLMIIDSENGAEITDFECLITLTNGKMATLKQPVLISCIQKTYLYSGDELMDYDDCFAIEDIQRVILVHNVIGIEIQYDFEFNIWNYSFLD
ncbi:MAG: hypothetical protein AB7V36_08385 [Bacteroidales bacterium]